MLAVAFCIVYLVVGCWIVVCKGAKLCCCKEGEAKEKNPDSESKSQQANTERKLNPSSEKADIEIEGAVQPERGNSDLIAEPAQIEAYMEESVQAPNENRQVEPPVEVRDQRLLLIEEDANRPVEVVPEQIPSVQRESSSHSEPIQPESIHVNANPNNQDENQSERDQSAQPSNAEENSNQNESNNGGNALAELLIAILGQRLQADNDQDNANQN